jgi:hypothetical protein
MSKILLTVAIAVTFLTALAHAATPQFLDATAADNFKLYWCVKADNPPVIDGKMDESVWNKAEPLTDWGITNYGRQKGSLGDIDFRTLWDEKNLYIGARMYHRRKPEDMKEFIRNVSDTTKEIYSRECLEIHIDGNLDHVTRFQAIVNPLPEKMMIWHYDFGWGLLTNQDYGLDADWEVVGSIGKDYWSVEIRMALQDIQVQPRCGYMFGINPCWFNWADTREEASHYWWQFVTWSTHNDSHHDPRLYGRFILVEKKPENIREGLKLAFPDLEKRVVTLQTTDGFITFANGNERFESYTGRVRIELASLKKKSEECTLLFAGNEKLAQSAYYKGEIDKNIEGMREVEKKINEQKEMSVGRLREYRTKIAELMENMDNLYWRAKQHVLLLSLSATKEEQK